MASKAPNVNWLPNNTLLRRLLKHFVSPQAFAIKESLPKCCHVNQLKTEAIGQFSQLFMCLIYPAEFQEIKTKNKNKNTLAFCILKSELILDI